MKLRIIGVLVLIALSGMAQVPTNGLVLQYDFDGTATDIGNFVGSPKDSINMDFGTDRFGNENSAALFGINSVLQYETDSFFDFSQENAFSISFWYYDDPQSLSSSRVMMGFDAGCDEFSFNTQVKTDSVLSFNQHGEASVGDDGCWNVVATLSRVKTWQHIAVTVSGTERYYYLNGSLIQQIQLISSPFKHREESTLSFGGWKSWYGSSYNSFFTGKLDDILIYDRILSQNEVSDIYSDTPNSVKEIESSMSINYFQNNISVKDVSSNTTIFVFNIEGQLVKQQVSNEMNIADLASGLYVVKALTNNRESTIKIVK